MPSLGDAIKRLREEKGISMDEMANQLKQFDVSPSKSMISRWENNKAEPSLEYARILSKYFNVTLDFLLGLESNDASSDLIGTLAAHHEGEDWSKEELEDIEMFKELMKQKRLRK